MSTVPEKHDCEPQTCKECNDAKKVFDLFAFGNWGSFIEDFKAIVNENKSVPNYRSEVRYNLRSRTIYK